MADKRKIHNKNGIKRAMVHDYPPIEGGGLEIHVYKCSRYLLKRGVDVRIFSSREFSHNFSYKIPKDNFVNIIKPTKKNISRIIKNFDLIHIHLTFSLRYLSTRVMDYCIKYNKPFIVSFHTSPDHIRFSRIAKSKKRCEMVRQIVKKINKSHCIVITYSEYNVRQIRKIGIKKDIIHLPLGIDPPFVLSNKTEEIYDVAFVGELSLMKGIDIFLKALLYLRNNYKNDIKSLIIGDGPQRKFMMNFICTHKLNAVYKGYIRNANVYNNLKMCKILVHTSRTDVFPTTILESLYMNKPVVAINVGGIPEAVRNHGVLTSSSPKSIAKAIYSLISNNEKRRSITYNSRAVVKRFHNMRNQIDMYLNIYKGLIKNEMFRIRGTSR